jgi:hypothetical protein
MTKRRKAPLSQEQTLVNIIKKNVDEAGTGHSRAEAIGVALKAYYEHQSVKAKCRAVNSLAKAVTRNAEIMATALKELGELSK